MPTLPTIIALNFIINEGMLEVLLPCHHPHHLHTLTQAPAAPVPTLPGGGPSEVLPRDEEVHLYPSALPRGWGGLLGSSHHLSPDDCKECTWVLSSVQEGEGVGVRGERRATGEREGEGGGGGGEGEGGRGGRGGEGEEKGKGREKRRGGRRREGEGEGGRRREGEGEGGRGM